MSSAAVSLIVLLALAFAAPAAAAPGVAIAPVKGDAGGKVGAQVTGALCPPLRCMPGDLGGRPDPSRALRAGADAALLSSIWRERRGRVLSLALFTRASRPERSWVLPLGPDGLVPPERLDAFAREVTGALGVAPPKSVAPPPVPLPAPAPPPQHVAAAPVLRAPRPRAEPSTGSRAEPLAPRERPSPPAITPAPDGAADPLVAIEAGIEPTRRTLRFPAGGTAPVAYGVTMPSTPFLALEFHPLRSVGGEAAGLALFADGSYLPGIALPSGARTHLATSLAYRWGLSWRIPVGDRLVLAPAVAWERESFTVTTSDGGKVPGLADDRRTGPSAAIGLEVPLAGRVTALAGGRVTLWSDARDLAGGAAFFPGGRAVTLEGEAGLALRLARRVSVRALASYADTRWTFEPDPSGAYTVGSARSERLGGRVTLRLGL